MTKKFYTCKDVYDGNCEVWSKTINDSLVSWQKETERLPFIVAKAICVILSWKYKTNFDFSKLLS